MNTASSKPPTRKHGRHLRVPVLPDEEQAIKQNAALAGMPVAQFLRAVGQSYQPASLIDTKKFEELSKINADLGRLGGLLKLWLTDDQRTQNFGRATIEGVLSKIEDTQQEMKLVMTKLVGQDTNDR